MSPRVSDSLPVHMSVPFVSCSWMSDIFTTHDVTSFGTCYATVHNRLLGLCLSPTVVDTLLRLARVVDALNVLLDASPDYARELGLTKDHPLGDGYPAHKGLQSKVFYALMSALVLDRSLWALGVGGVKAAVHWYHPYNPEPSQALPPVELPGTLEIDSIRKSIGAVGLINGKGFKDAAVASNVVLAARSVSNSSTSDLYGVFANLDYMGAVIISLSKVRASR